MLAKNEDREIIGISNRNKNLTTKVKEKSANDGAIMTENQNVKQ